MIGNKDGTILIDVREYEDEAGRSPFAEWFERLDAIAAAKVTVFLERVAHGNTSNLKTVGQGVLELRIDFGPGYRIYLGRDGEALVILLGGGLKRRQQNRTSQPGRFVGATTRNAREKAELEMPLTRSFKETVKARADRDAKFREALLTEGVEAMLAGELDIGKAIIRDYINATVGFEPLSTATGTPVKSLMRMFGPRGNPNARNLLSVLGELQRAAGINLRVSRGE